MSIKFQPGQIVATPGALEALEAAGQRPGEFLARHISGDWGEPDDEDRALNDSALIEGSRLLSAYRTKKNERLWIVTEGCDNEGRRPSTCLLLPEEY
jgi:hypothetical protein